MISQRQRLPGESFAHVILREIPGPLETAGGFLDCLPAQAPARIDRKGLEALRQGRARRSPRQHARQHLGRAHVEVERLMVERLRSQPDLSPHSTEFLCWLHRQFYERLPEHLHWSRDRNGRKYEVEPGGLRAFEVDVGAHQPPHHAALPRVLARFAEPYASASILATDQLVALALPLTTA